MARNEQVLRARPRRALNSAARGEREQLSTTTRTNDNKEKLAQLPSNRFAKVFDEQILRLAHDEVTERTFRMIAVDRVAVLVDNDKELLSLGIHVVRTLQEIVA